MFARENAQWTDKGTADCVKSLRICRIKADKNWSQCYRQAPI
jgi:hypothetical protein